MQPYPRALDLVWPGQIQLHGLPQCPGFGHWVSYCCVVLVFRSGLRLGVGFGNSASPGWGLGRACLSTVCGVVSLFPAGVCGVRGLAWVLARNPPFVVGDMGRRMVACALRPHPTVSGSGVRCGRACWGLRFGCALPLFGGVLGCVCARAPFPGGLLYLLVWGAVRGCVFVRAPCLFPAFPGWGVLCGRACWARVSAVPRFFFFLWVVGVCFSFHVLLWLCGVGRWPSLSQALWSLSPLPLPFGLGCRLFLFFSPSAVCVCAFWVFLPPDGPLLLAGCCRFWLGGPPVRLRGSRLWSLLGARLGRPLWCLRAVWWLWAVLSPPPPRPPLFFGGGRLPVPPSAFPGLAHALARILCGPPGCCWRLRSAWLRPGPMGRVGYVHVGLGAPSCRVRSWLCRLGGCARRLRVALG